MPPNNRAIRTPAIILRRRDFGEADRLLTVLTPYHGKLDLIAYGARKAVSRKTGHVELFTLADMLVNLHKNPGVVSQVEMLEPFLPLRDDLTLGAFAGYVVELLDRFT
ncbi:MAG: DNA repair protein RecO, partial [Chloroflexota bacterium]